MSKARALAVINGSAAIISKILTLTQFKKVYLIYISQLSTRPCYTPCESSNVASDSPISKVNEPIYTVLQ
jgi:hypothetical protein